MGGRRVCLTVLRAVCIIPRWVDEREGVAAKQGYLHWKTSDSGIYGLDALRAPLVNLRWAVWTSLGNCRDLIILFE